MGSVLIQFAVRALLNGQSERVQFELRASRAGVVPMDGAAHKRAASSQKPWVGIGHG
jgi:hypothetical protein